MLCGGFPPWATGDSFSYVHFLVGLLAFLCILPTTIAIRSEDGDLLSPLPILGGVMFLYFPYRSLYLLSIEDVYAHLPPNIDPNFLPHMIDALELTTMCWIVVLAVYYSPLGTLLGDLMPRPKLFFNEVSLGRVHLVFAISVAAKAYQVYQGQHLAFRMADNINYDVIAFIDLMSSWGAVAVFLYAALYYRGRLSGPAIIYFFGGVVPATMIYGVLTGSKERVVAAPLMILFARHYFKKRIGVREALYMLAIYTLFVAPIVTQIRDYHDFEKLGSSSGLSIMTIVRAAEDVNRSDDYAATSYDRAVDRFHGIDSVMIATQMTPRFLPYRDAELYLLFPVMAVVPRFMWKQKPKMTLIPEWETVYWGQNASNKSSVARSHVGALYLCFGTLGAVLGMGLLALFWRLTYQFFCRSAGLAGTMFYVNNLNLLLHLENDVPILYAGMIKVSLVLIGLLWFVGVRESVLRTPATARAI